MLALLELPFNVTSADVDEAPRNGELPSAMALRLAQAKAELAAQNSCGGTVIIAADTIGSLDNMPLGKPVDAADAGRILRTLRGRVHQVYTGIALVDTRSGRQVCELATTDVLMRRYAEAEMLAYIASGDPLDKAAAYAIQHAGFHPVENLMGCFANVMGFPLCHLARSLRKLDIKIVADVPTACQQHISHQCPVYPHILAAG